MVFIPSSHLDDPDGVKRSMWAPRSTRQIFPRAPEPARPTRGNNMGRNDSRQKITGAK
jgi:hypothetical protein